jgi:exonuclease SbcC
MILLKSLQLNNFLSHANTRLDFSDNQKLLVNGNSGSGKSSLFEAIIWSLYGQGRSNNASLIRHGEPKGEVILTLDEGGSLYEIHRAVTAKGKQTLTVKKDGKAIEITGLKPLQAWIEKELIGASYLLFVNSAAYLQNGADTFVTQTAARRKELLLEIVQTDNIDDHYDQTRELIKTKETELKVIESKIGELTNTLLHEDALILVKDTLKEKAEEARTQRERLDIELTSLSVKKASIDTLGARMRAAQSSIDEYDADIKDLLESVKSVKEAENELKNLQNNADALNHLNSQKTLLEAEIASGEGVLAKEHEKTSERAKLLAEKPDNDSIIKEIEQLEEEEKTWKDKPDCPSKDNCPYMSSKTTRLDQISYKKTELLKDVLKRTEEMKEWQLNFDAVEAKDVSDVEAKLAEDQARLTGVNLKIEAENKALQKRDSLKEAVATLPGLETKLAGKRQSRKTAVDALDEIKKDSDDTDIQALDLSIHTLKTEIEKLKEQESEALAELKHIAKIEEGIKAKEKELTDLKNQTSKIGVEIRKLKLLKEAFSSKGIKAVVVDYLLPNLEEKINYILGKMSDFTISLTTQKPTADGEGTVEGLFINVFNELGEQMDFDSYSGGEKLKIVVAISEALATLQKVGFRLYDEIFIGLDENSIAAFNKVIYQLQENYNQMLVISHLDEIKSTFEEDQIVINKHNGVSKII